MKARVVVPLLLVAGILCGCGPAASHGTKENIDAAEKAVAARLKPAKDPVGEAIWAAKLKTRQAFNSKRFDDLEAEASALRKGKETYGDGTWKILQFYNALDCADEEPESMWKLHESIYQAWMGAKPQSITARVAYGAFLINYAWQARGSGYANEVTKEGWRLFGERLSSAGKVLIEARSLAEKDPCLWYYALTVARGQGWSPDQFKAVLDEGRAHEPKFWGYDTARAYSLLPRWHGEPGDWEAFAEESAARPDGLGAEVYARIVISLRDYHGHVFRESKASWPKTKEGLQVLLEKYPESLWLLSEATMLATMAEDREMAKRLFERIGDRYLRSTWEEPERFAHFRNWAETGNW
jgi:hypothetical protein